MNTQAPLILGCSTLRKELCLLIERNGWPHEARFLPSTLHCNFTQLGKALRQALDLQKERPTLLLYGQCHPCMEEIVKDSQATRMPCENCIELLLGRECYTEHLAAGAFFLLEDWMQHLPEILASSLGTRRPELIREIFQSEKKYLLAIRTPCSGDFARQAQEAADLTGLPLFWLDTGLDDLERALSAVIRKEEPLHHA
jgi:hypothetical protein